jgi:hypothetical protein
MTTDPTTTELPKEITGDADAMQSMTIATNAVNVVASYDIQDADDANMASQELAHMVARRRAMDEKRVFLKAPSLETGRRLDEFFREPLAILDGQIRALKGKIGTYMDAVDRQQRIAREAQRKLEEDARQESQRLARLADQAAIDAEMDGRDKEAEKHVTHAEEHRQQAAQPVNVSPPAERTVIAGASASRPWKGELMDIDALIVAAASNAYLRGLLKADESAINAFAKSTKGSKDVPGVRFYQQTTVTSRSKRS